MRNLVDRVRLFLYYIGRKLYDGDPAPMGIRDAWEVAGFMVGFWRDWQSLEDWERENR